MHKEDLLLRNRIEFLIAVWLSHFFLRVLQLGRNDAYGFPLVSKFDWYIFHAACYDFVWISLWSLPFLLLFYFFRSNHRLCRKLTFCYYIFHTVFLLLTVVNHEFYRFWGGHLTIDLLLTYTNTTGLHEVTGFLHEDLSVPYLPYLLFFGSVPFCFFIYSLIRNRTNFKLRNVIATLIITNISAWTFTEIVWPGTFRKDKLKPFVYILTENIKELNKAPIPFAEIQSEVLQYQKHWKSQANTPGDWIFPDSTLPYYKVPLFKWCQSPENQDRENCLVDKDLDGHTASLDCDDRNPSVYPGATDIPSNGVDEDCSGVDSKPANIVMLFLESHRALNMGFLKDYGAKFDASPVLNQLARDAHIFTRFFAGGIPTVNALLATHLGIHAHPQKNISTSFLNLRHTSFVNHLRDQGYQAHFFSTPDPSWDNEIPWLRNWYGNYTYHRSREDDVLSLQYMAQWIKDNFNDNSPFIATAITKVNHYPFNPVPGMGKQPDKATLEEKMVATMAYAEKALQLFLDSISGESWFENTLVFILADHGFSLGEHGPGTTGWSIYPETTWIPLMILGHHPKMGPSTFHHFPAGQTDLAPTILDLAGITEANHFVGHSLFRQNAEESNEYLLFLGNNGVMESKGIKVHTSIDKRNIKEFTREVYLPGEDPLETNNLVEEFSQEYESFSKFVTDRYKVHKYVIEQNRLQPATKDK